MCVLVNVYWCTYTHTHTHTHTQKHTHTKTRPLTKKEGEDTNVGTHVRYGCSLLQYKFEKHEQRADDSFQANCSKLHGKALERI